MNECSPPASSMTFAIVKTLEIDWMLKRVPVVTGAAPSRAVPPNPSSQTVRPVASRNR